MNKHKAKDMKIFKFTLFLALILLVGGFGYFAFTDVPVQQTEVSKEIPNERLFDE